MRILFLSSIYPRSHQPALGIFCRNWCAAMAAHHQVRVISPSSWIDKLRRRGATTSTGADGIQVDYPSYFYPPKLLRSAYGWFMWMSIRRLVRRTIDEFKPDFVLGYWAHPDGAVAVRAARLAGAAAGVIVGGSDVLLLTRNPRRRAKVVRVLQDADIVIAVSESLKRKTIELGIPAEKIQVVYQGLDVGFSTGDRTSARRRVGIASDRPVLLWVGRMVPVKGLDVLLRAAAMLRDGGIEYELYLVGEGPMQSQLEKQRNRLGLKDRVHFAGARLHEQLPDWYRAANLTVLPSLSEGLPNVLRESLGCGTPFVASDVGGVAEIADESCKRCPPGDAAALASALAEMLSTPETAPLPKRQLNWNESAAQLLRGVLTEAQA